MVTVSLRIFLSAVVRVEFPSLTVTKINYRICSPGAGGGCRGGQLAEHGPRLVGLPTKR